MLNTSVDEARNATYEDHETDQVDQRNHNRWGVEIAAAIVFERIAPRILLEKSLVLATVKLKREGRTCTEMH